MLQVCTASFDQSSMPFKVTSLHLPAPAAPVAPVASISGFHCNSCLGPYPDKAMRVTRTGGLPESNSGSASALPCECFRIYCNRQGRKKRPLRFLEPSSLTNLCRLGPRLCTVTHCDCIIASCSVMPRVHILCMTSFAASGPVCKTCGGPD